MSQQPSTLAGSTPIRVPGYLSVKAAAQALGIRERSVRHLIERQRLTSVRLGRMHFIPTRLVHAYGVERRLRLRQMHRGGRRVA